MHKVVYENPIRTQIRIEVSNMVGQGPHQRREKGENPSKIIVVFKV